LEEFAQYLNQDDTLHSVDILMLSFIFTLAVLLLWRLHAVKLAQRAHRKAELALAVSTEEQRVLRAVARHANDGLVYQDMEGHILWANPAYCRTMGYQLSEIIGRKPQEFCFAPDKRPSDEQIADFRFDPDDRTFTDFHRHPNVRKNGEEFWHEFSQAVVEPNPGEQRVILVSRDVTHQVQREQELEAAREDLHRAAFHDALTGLQNRVAFSISLDNVLASSRPSENEVGLLYIDSITSNPSMTATATRPVMPFWSMWPMRSGPRWGPMIWAAVWAAMNL